MTGTTVDDPRLVPALWVDVDLETCDDRQLLNPGTTVRSARSRWRTAGRRHRRPGGRITLAWVEGTDGGALRVAA